MAHRTWQELSPGQRTAVLVVASVEIALTATAAADLARRPQSQIRGPKALWWLGIFVQPFGPAVYLGWACSQGPRRGGSSQ
jgi:Na+/proline symporter